MVSGHSRSYCSGYPTGIPVPKILVVILTDVPPAMAARIYHPVSADISISAIASSAHVFAVVFFSALVRSAFVPVLSPATTGQRLFPESLVARNPSSAPEHVSSIYPLSASSSLSVQAACAPKYRTCRMS